MKFASGVITGIVVGGALAVILMKMQARARRPGGTTGGSSGTETAQGTGMQGAPSSFHRGP